MNQSDSPRRIVVGITGASGTPIARRLLTALKQAGCETHLVYTTGAAMTCTYECGFDISELADLADMVYDNTNIGAAIASGTFSTMGMIILPCSMKTVAGIASGYSDNLLLRAADVAIKEQRKLVLAVRETPLSSIHLNNMAALANIPGVSILPLMMTWYNGPTTISDMEDHLVGKILARFGLDYAPFKPWS